MTSAMTEDELNNQRPIHFGWKVWLASLSCFTFTSNPYRSRSQQHVPTAKRWCLFFHSIWIYGLYKYFETRLSRDARIITIWTTGIQISPIWTKHHLTRRGPGWVSFAEARSFDAAWQINDSLMMYHSHTLPIIPAVVPVEPTTFRIHLTP